MKSQLQQEMMPLIYGENSVKIIVGQKTQPRNICFGLHWHDRFELIRVTYGEFELFTGDDKVVVGKGEAAIICPYQPHSGIAGKRGCEYDVIMFDVSLFFNGTLASGKYLEPLAAGSVFFSHKSSAAELIETADKIVALHGDKSGNPVMVIGAVYSLIGILYKNCTEALGGDLNGDSRFNDVTEYIGAHFNERISTASLSEIFGYDEAYFCRRFKKAAGISAMKYIQVLRMKKALEILKKEDIGISETACRCGFSDIHYFTRCFKKHFGITPSEFKHQNQS